MEITKYFKAVRVLTPSEQREQKALDEYRSTRAVNALLDAREAKTARLCKATRKRQQQLVIHRDEQHWNECQKALAVVTGKGKMLKKRVKLVQPVMTSLWLVIMKSQMLTQRPIRYLLKCRSESNVST